MVKHVEGCANPWFWVGLVDGKEASTVEGQVCQVVQGGEEPLKHMLTGCCRNKIVSADERRTASVSP